MSDTHETIPTTALTQPATQEALPALALPAPAPARPAARSLSRRDFLRAMLAAPIVAGSLVVLPDEAEAASKVKVWVVAKYGDTKYETRVPSYNKNGLVTYSGEPTFGYGWYYKSNGRIKSYIWYNAGAWHSYYYGAKGQITRMKGNGTDTYSYKGRTFTIKKSSSTYTYTLDSKGRIKSIKAKVTYLFGETGKSTTTYTYDKHGNRKKLVEVEKINKKSEKKSTVKYKNSYDKLGRLKKVIAMESYYDNYSNGDGTPYRSKKKSTYKCSYKQISVPKKFANQVKWQQWALLNGYDYRMDIAYILGH